MCDDGCKHGDCDNDEDDDDDKDDSDEEDKDEARRIKTSISIPNYVTARACGPVDDVDCGGVCLREYS